MTVEHVRMRGEREADLAKLTIVYLTHSHHAISISLILHNNNNDKENVKRGRKTECTRNRPSHIPLTRHDINTTASPKNTKTPTFRGSVLRVP